MAPPPGTALGASTGVGRAPADRSVRTIAPIGALTTLRSVGSFGPATFAAPTTDAVVGLLLGHRGHREVILGRDPATAALALLDSRELRDVGEHVGDLDEVAAGVAPEAHDLDTDAELLDGADGGREVAVARDHDRDVDVLGHAHHVHHELDVQVRLDAPVTVLADVLAHDLVAAAAKEGMELALVLVLGIQPGVGIRPDEDRVRRSMP